MIKGTFEIQTKRLGKSITRIYTDSNVQTKV